MFKIETIAPENATGKIAEVYSMFPPEMGVPWALQMLSASEEIMMMQLQGMEAWKSREFSEGFRTSIRYKISGLVGMDHCQGTNGQLLQMQGMTAEQVESLNGSIDQWPLSAKENALIDFVSRTIPDRKPADEKEITTLREMGWSDSAILEALCFGGMVISVLSCVKVLKK